MSCDAIAQTSSSTWMRILFFAQLREVTGLAQAEIAAGGVDASALWGLLVEQWPGLAAHRDATRLARNGCYARPEDVFADSDEVALIPPVSGG